MNSDNDSLNEMTGSDSKEREEVHSNPTYFVDGKEYHGSISDIDPSSIASVRVVKNDPAYPESKVMITTKQADSKDDKSYKEPEKLAEFKGGEKELLAFLVENIKYPALDSEIPDSPVRVILSFNILTDGRVDDIKVRKSGGEAFDAEAINVVAKTSGKWEPAEDNGKPVVSQFTIPITFMKKS